MLCLDRLSNTDVNGGNAPSNIILRSGIGNSIVIGRGSIQKLVDYVISVRVGNNEMDDVISREHSKISISSDSTFTMEDLNSLNGTFVNKKKISYCNLQGMFYFSCTCFMCILSLSLCLMIYRW